MDFRLKLLLHIPLGLRLDSDEVSRLTAPDLEPENRQHVLDALQSAAARTYLHKNPDWSEASERLLQLSAKHSICWSYVGQADYPLRWLNLSQRPVVFSYRGEPSWLTMPTIAAVGSRSPSTETLAWMQRDFSEFLRRRPTCVVSGGARGIDQWAHRLAMANRRPTICVFPSGLLNPYPFDCQPLWEEILQAGGCLLSTCGLFEPLHKSFFHIRNRWIAGLAPICFVAEANRRSGSALTAKLALDEGRDVCTLPVFPTAHQGLANLDLISTGATMLRDHHDLITLWDRTYSAGRATPAPE